MTKIMIVGAHGAMARLLMDRLLNETTDTLTLFLRDAARLAQYANNPRVTLVDGDIKDTALVAKTMQDADIVYSNLGGAGSGGTDPERPDRHEADGQATVRLHQRVGRSSRGPW